jgi:signal transduction histidine kinase
MSSAKILIVEDEEELAELLAYNLRKEGYSVLCAHDGLNACRLAGAERPDLILLDILLPDLDGWEICRLIRAHQDADLATTPIVMLTALGALDDRLKGLELGADAYLAKPYVLRELLVRVRQLLARRRERAAMAAEMAALRAGTELQADLQDLLFHELSNQMVVIGGFSGLLARGGGQVSTRDGLRAIHRSAEYLSSMAEGFLLTRRLESGAFELPREEVSLSVLLDELAELYHPHAAENRTVLRSAGISELPPLNLNRAAVRVILSSLIENAIKYSGEEAEVLLRLHRSDTGDVLVEVRDDGPGIPEAEADHIFDRFYRGRDSAGKTRGSGLGLYLSRTLARHLGGDVTVHGARKRGACFVLRFPPSAGKDEASGTGDCRLGEAGR